MTVLIILETFIKSLTPRSFIALVYHLHNTHIPQINVNFSFVFTEATIISAKQNGSPPNIGNNINHDDKPPQLPPKTKNSAEKEALIVNDVIEPPREAEPLESQ